MTGIDLIVAAPWIIFAVVLATICIFLLRARRASGRDRHEPIQDPDLDPDPDPGSDWDSGSDSCLEEER